MNEASYFESNEIDEGVNATSTQLKEKELEVQDLETIVLQQIPKDFESKPLLKF